MPATSERLTKHLLPNGTCERMAVFVTQEDRKIEDSLRRIMQAFETALDLSRGVFLKPNIVFPVRQRSGEITRHKIVRGVINVLRELDSSVDIVIGEGTAAGTIAKENFSISKYSKLARNLKVDLVDLEEVEHVELKWEYGTLRLPQIAFERVYINLPILKTSSAADISGSMKNQKGLLPANTKKRFHKLGLHEPIAYLNSLVQPDLTIMDGVNFFSHNILISGDNTYEIDSLAARLLMVPEPRYLKTAHEIGVGQEDFRVSGIDVKKLKSNYRYQSRNYRNILRIRIWSNPKACSMCRYTLVRIRRRPLANLRYSVLMSLRLLKYVVTGAEIVIGADADFHAKYENVICVGNCTKELAENNGYVHIPGCPPSEKEMLSHI